MLNSTIVNIDKVGSDDTIFYMQYTLTGKLLLFLADWLDFNSRFSWRNFSAMSDDPRIHRHRKWLEKCLGNKREKEKLYNAFQSLKRSRFLQEKVLNNVCGYILSNKGKNRVFSLKIKQLNKEKNKDNAWLMVLFDIPEKLRKSRDFFRHSLRELGFEQLQKSVWVTPYNVASELEKLIAFGGLEKFVKFLTVKEVLR